MENEEVNIAYPFCYGCHERIDNNILMMRNQKFFFPFHESCFYKYIEEIRWKAPVIRGEA